MIKTILPLCYPLSLSLILLGAGLILLWRGRRVLLAKILCTLSFFILLLPANTWISRSWLSFHEYKHPPLDTSKLIEGAGTDVVVLGGGLRFAEGLPEVSQLSPTSIQRLVEGIRLHRRTGGRLILSGGGKAERSEADGMAALAQELGVPFSSLVIEEASMNTAEQANNLQPVLGGAPFILVTSADHMPRAAANFRGVGLKPLLAPVGHQTVLEVREIGNLFGIPYSGNLQAWERSFYESLASIRRKKSASPSL